MIEKNIIFFSPYSHIIRGGLLTLLIFCSSSFSSQNDPYDRDTAYIGGLSRQHFNKKRSDITIATEMFFKEVVSRIGFKNLDFSVNEDTTGLLRAMREDRLDAVFANPIDYLELDRQTHPDFRYTISYGEMLEQRIILLTRESDAITSLSQLKGKRLSITRDHILGEMFLEIQMATAGLGAPSRFFSGINETTSSNAAVLELFFAKADIAVTTDIAYELACDLNPQLKRQIHIFIASPPYIPFVIGVNKQVPPHLLSKIDAILLELKDQPRLKHILSLFSATDVVKVQNYQIEALRDLKRQHRKLVK